MLRVRDGFSFTPKNGKINRDEGSANSFIDNNAIPPSWDISDTHFSHLGYKYVQYENVSFTQLFT